MKRHVAFLLVCGLLASCTEAAELPLEEVTDETGGDSERFDLGVPLDASEDGEADVSVSGAVGAEMGAHTPVRLRPEPAHPAELAHVDGIGVPAQPLAGEPCDASSACEMGTQCVADEIGSDGTFRCLTVCVDPTAENADSITCLDDAGCCDGAAVCDDQGRCVLPGGGSGGGSDPAADGQGCNEGCDFDRDDDGVVNSLDANPDQSCSADADQDGVNDSCDANDMSGDDGCFGCAIPLMRTNGLAWVYALILISLRRRRPRRARRGGAPAPD